MRIFLCFIFLLSANSIASTNPIEQFAKDDLWDDVKISPYGEYLSAVTYLDGKRVIVLMDTKTLKPKHYLKFKGYAQPSIYHWIGRDRIVTQKEYLEGWRELPVNYAEMYAVNVDGGRATYAFGYKDMYTKNVTPMWGEMLDPLPDDAEFMLVVGTKMSRDIDHKPSVYRVNTFNGRMKKLTESPIENAEFLLDQQKNVRFVTGTDGAQARTFLRSGDNWLGTKDLNIANETFYPVAFKANSNQVYAQYSEDGGAEGLYLFDLDSGTKKLVFKNDKVSLSQVNVDSKGNVYAVEFEQGYPSIAFIDAENNEAKILKKLMKTLAGFNVKVLSETLDGENKIVFASNQFNPGDYLLYKVKQDQLVHLFSKRPWVNPDTIGNVVPFEFKSRDGLELDGYVTLPIPYDTLEQAKNLPLVVRVHGGPHGYREHFVYDSENQLFTSHGIAVLQVNFRGSTGYGSNFVRLGFKHWGDTMQFDIIDGVKSLIKQGIADKNKLCIMGASFGGYSAMQSSILEPDLFKCTVAVMGLYDLKLAYEIGDISNNKAGVNSLENYLGTDTAALLAASPLYHLEQLKSSVFIVHGEKDQRVPIKHATLLRAGLEKHTQDYQWLALEGESHGFYKPENRQKVMQQTIDFVIKKLDLKKQ